MESDDEIAFEDSDHDTTPAALADFEVLDDAGLESEIKDIIADVKDVMEVSSGVARILLQKYKWNKNSLMEKFYECTDTIAFLAASQVIPKPIKTEDAKQTRGLKSVLRKLLHVPEYLKGLRRSPSTSLTIEETREDKNHIESPEKDNSILSLGECDICCDLTELTSLACGHEACNTCWEMYLTDKINEGQCEMQCMAADCNLLMEEEQIMAYLKDADVIAKYHRVVLNQFVETNNLLCWCPAANCGKAIMVRYHEARLVVCTCGNRFCFSCGKDSHKPASCQLLHTWKKRCMEMDERRHKGEGFGADSETFTWLMSNTKDCPRCFVSIEKNGGCNYMQCRNSNCRFQFCWICMKDWSVHRNGWYSCNAYDPNAEESRNSKRAELHRFLFYYTRFINHEKSLKLEEKLRRTVSQRMTDMEQMSLRWIDVQYLQKAVDTLSECRKAMMYTYVFAFYLKRDNNSLIFEANQRDLELATEQLSGFLERELEGQDFDNLRQNVLDKSRYVEHRLQVLMEHCAEGEEQEFWQFHE